MTNTTRDSETAVAQSSLDLDGMRILVVDNDQTQTEMYAYALERLGADVAPAASVDEAIETVVSGRFDAVVSDISLPVRDGYELARELRAAGIWLPVVALTGWSEPGEREAALAAGFDELCTKPCLPSELARVIAGLVAAVSAAGAR